MKSLIDGLSKGNASQPKKVKLKVDTNSEISTKPNKNNRFKKPIKFKNKKTSIKSL